MLHRGERRTLTTKQIRETEAEAVSFVVCQSVGLQTGTASTDYIQLWHGDANLLQESLEVVQRTATVILGALPPRRARPSLRKPLWTRHWRETFWERAGPNHGKTRLSVVRTPRAGGNHTLQSQDGGNVTEAPKQQREATYPHSLDAAVPE